MGQSRLWRDVPLFFLKDEILQGNIEGGKDREQGKYKCEYRLLQVKMPIEILTGQRPQEDNKSDLEGKPRVPGKIAQAIRLILVLPIHVAHDQLPPL